MLLIHPESGSQVEQLFSPFGQTPGRQKLPRMLKPLLEPFCKRFPTLLQLLPFPVEFFSAVFQIFSLRQ